MTTIAEPDSTVATDDGRAPRCEIRWHCSDNCCPPTRCPDRAEYRVTFRCASTDCDHAGDLLLMCERCTEQADALGSVLARRPL